MDNHIDRPLSQAEAVEYDELSKNVRWGIPDGTPDPRSPERRKREFIADHNAYQKLREERERTESPFISGRLLKKLKKELEYAKHDLWTTGDRVGECRKEVALVWLKIQMTRILMFVEFLIGCAFLLIFVAVIWGFFWVISKLWN